MSARAGVARSLISMVERGHLDHITVVTLRRIAVALDVRLDVVPRWRGGELDRLLDAQHSRFHELVARSFERLVGWTIAPEVSFSYFGERGVIDILAWHASTRSLLVIELRTEVVDVQELMGSMDRRRRLASRVARERGWSAATVASWVVVSATRANRRRIAAHAATLRAAFPDDRRTIGQWLRQPVGTVAALSRWPVVDDRDTRPPMATRRRVRVRRSAA